jgi:hypothetical protein
MYVPKLSDWVAFYCDCQRQKELFFRKEFQTWYIVKRVNHVLLGKVCCIKLFQEDLAVRLLRRGGYQIGKDGFGLCGGGGATDYYKTACLGFSTSLGERFSNIRFVRAFLGFLQEN